MLEEEEFKAAAVSDLRELNMNTLHKVQIQGSQNAGRVSRLDEVRQCGRQCHHRWRGLVCRHRGVQKVMSAKIVPKHPVQGESQRWLLFPVWLSGRGGVREVAVFSFYPLLPTAHVNKSSKRTGMSSISNMMFTSPYVQSQLYVNKGRLRRNPQRMNRDGSKTLLLRQKGLSLPQCVQSLPLMVSKCLKKY